MATPPIINGPRDAGSRFSLKGASSGDEGDAPRLERGMSHAAFPEPWSDGELDIAVDGWFVKDRRLVVDSPMARRAIAEAVRSDLAAYLRSLGNGAFTLAVHDRQRRITRIASDRLGMLPIYVHSGGGRCAFASDLATLFGLIGGRPPIDPVGAAEIYLIGYPIGDRTAHAGVSDMPPGTISTFDWNGGTRSDVRWTETSAAADPDTRGLDAILDDLVETASRAVNAFDVPERPFGADLGIKLSAGMDSRLIAGSWHGGPLRAYTFGEPESAEVRIAGMLARSLGIPHSVDPIRGDIFAQVFDDQMARFDLAEFFHGFMTPRMVADGVHAVFDGLGGDVLIGGVTLKRKGSRLGLVGDALGIATRTFDPPHDDESLARFMLDQIRVPDDDLPVLSPDARHQIDACTPAILADLAAQAAHYRPQSSTFEDLYSHLMVNNRFRRYIAMQGAMCRPEVESLYPLLDVALEHLVARVPMDLLSNKRLYIELFSRRFPRIRGVPGVMSLLPYSVPARLHYLGRIVRYGLDMAVKVAPAIAPGRAVNGVQWELWFRRDREMRHGFAQFLAGSRAIDQPALARALDEVRAGKRVVRGTRIALTATYGALFR
jgi:asparagine synthetase B (glutamine-hydrolysing)